MDFISIEEAFNQSLLDIDGEYSNCEVDAPWDKTPRFFTTLADWPKETNLKCWYCTLKFKTAPWFIIMYCNNTPNGVVMDTRGNFCSCGCVMGFVLAEYDKHLDFDKKFNIYRLYKIFTGKDTKNIKPPKPFYSMEMYGGSMSLDDYRAHVHRVDVENMSSGDSSPSGSNA